MKPDKVKNMEREITKNADGTFKVVESNVVESVTREQLGIFRDKLKDDIERMEKNAGDLKAQLEKVNAMLKEEKK
jgi:hypothetical protein